MLTVNAVVCFSACHITPLLILSVQMFSPSTELPCIFYFFFLPPHNLQLKMPKWVWEFLNRTSQTTVDRDLAVQRLCAGEAVVSGDGGTLPSPTLPWRLTYGAPPPLPKLGFCPVSELDAHSKSSQSHRWHKGQDRAEFPLQDSGARHTLLARAKQRVFKATC